MFWIMLRPKVATVEMSAECEAEVLLPGNKIASLGQTVCQAAKESTAIFFYCNRCLNWPFMTSEHVLQRVDFP